MKVCWFPSECDMDTRSWQTLSGTALCVCETEQCLSGGHKCVCVFVCVHEQEYKKVCVYDREYVYVCVLPSYCPSGLRFCQAVTQQGSDRSRLTLTGIGCFILIIAALYYQCAHTHTHLICLSVEILCVRIEKTGLRHEDEIHLHVVFHMHYVSAYYYNIVNTLRRHVRE